MKSRVLIGVLMAVAGCGGASPKAKHATTLPASQPVAAAAADDTPPGPDPEAETGNETRPAEGDVPSIKSPTRPPSQDLSPEKRALIVKDALKRGHDAILTGDADTAIRAARSALDADESNVEAMVLLANGYYLKQYDDKAEAVLTIAQKQKAGKANPTLYMILGLVYERTSKEDQALAAYERAATLKPDYVAAQTNRGAIYLKRKRYTDAINVFAGVVKLQDGSPRAHSDLGCAYRGRSADSSDPNQRASLLKQANAELIRAMTLDPKYAPAYFNLGILYLDADPYPGMENLLRYQTALKYLTDYRRVAGPSAVAQADDYVVASQKGIEREQKLLDRKKKRDSEKGKKGGTQ